MELLHRSSSTLFFHFGLPNIVILKIFDCVNFSFIIAGLRQQIKFNKLVINDSPFVSFLQIMIPFSELSIYRLELGYLSWNLPTRIQVVDMA
jgi:hypothetical protein